MEYSEKTESGQNLIDEMYQGYQPSILKGLTHSAALLRANAIVASTRNGINTAEILPFIRKLTEDHTCLFGYNAGPTVSDFAVSALHLLGVDPYQGDRKEILDFIQCKLDF